MRLPRRRADREHDEIRPAELDMASTSRSNTGAPAAHPPAAV
jgi:hypothetical protein